MVGSKLLRATSGKARKHARAEQHSPWDTHEVRGGLGVIQACSKKLSKVEPEPVDDFLEPQPKYGPEILDCLILGQCWDPSSKHPLVPPWIFVSWGGDFAPLPPPFGKLGRASMSTWLGQKKRIWLSKSSGLPAHAWLQHGSKIRL